MRRQAPVSLKSPHQPAPRTARLLVIVLLAVAALQSPDGAAQQRSANSDVRAAFDELRDRLERQQQLLENQQRELQRQREEIRAQQRRIDNLEEQETVTAKPEPKTPAPDEPAATAKTRDPKSTGAAIPLGTNIKDEDKEKRGALMLPGTQLSFDIGGYAKADFIHDFGNAGDEDTFVPSLIPVSGPSEDRDGRTRFLARQSRINIDVRRPDTPWGTFHAFVEGDFFGGGGNQRVSNSDGFRLRHAYGELGNLLVGQTWSTFMDVAALPGTLDFSGPGGQSFIRQGQVRWTQIITPELSLAFALENPEGDVLDTDGDRTTGAGNPINLDEYPDAVVRGRYSGAWGHLQSGLLLRQISVDNDAGFAEDETGYGVNVSGAIKTPSLGRNDAFMFQVNYGDGIGRYILDIAGSGADAVIDSRRNRLQTLDAWGGYVAFEHWWGHALRSALVGSYVHLDNLRIQGPNTFDNSVYSAVNLIWSPLPQVNLGVEYLYGRRENRDGATGDASRVQTSAQFFF